MRAYLRFSLAPAIATAVALACASAPVQPRARVMGCWQSKRPIGRLAPEPPAPRDSGFMAFVLHDNWGVSLPRLSPEWKATWTAGSFWDVRGDSIVLRVGSGGGARWDVSLVQHGKGDPLRGTTTHIINNAPERVPALLQRTACDSSWPRVASGKPALRGWEKGEPLFFAYQVDRAAALRPDGRLPEGIVSAHSFEIGDRPPDRLVSPTRATRFPRVHRGEHGVRRRNTREGAASK